MTSTQSVSRLFQTFTINSNDSTGIISTGVLTNPIENVALTINNGNTNNLDVNWKTLIVKSNQGDNLSFGTYQFNNNNNASIASTDRITGNFKDIYLNNTGIDVNTQIGNVIIAGKTTIGNNSNTVEKNYTFDVFSKYNNNNIALLRNSNLELRFFANSNINISTNNDNLNINSRTYFSEYISINSNNFVPTNNEKLVVNGISVFNSNVIINGRIGGNFSLDSDTNFSERNKLPGSVLNVAPNSGISSNLLNQIFLNIDTDSGLLLNNNVISLNPLLPNIQTQGQLILGDITNDTAGYAFYTSKRSKFNNTVIMGSNPTSTSLNLSDYILNINGNMGITGNIFNASDSNLKQNIQTYPNALDNILKCRGVLYEFKDDYKKNIGVIAQEIEKIIPEIVETTTDGIKNVNYLGFIGVIIEAIKELNNKIICSKV
jgi:hypothetical protein